MIYFEFSWCSGLKYIRETFVILPLTRWSFPSNGNPTINSTILWMWDRNKSTLATQQTKQIKTCSPSAYESFFLFFSMAFCLLVHFISYRSVVSCLFNEIGYSKNKQNHVFFSSKLSLPLKRMPMQKRCKQTNRTHRVTQSLIFMDLSSTLSSCSSSQTHRFYSRNLILRWLMLSLILFHFRFKFFNTNVFNMLNRRYWLEFYNVRLSTY